MTTTMTTTMTDITPDTGPNTGPNTDPAGTEAGDTAGDTGYLIKDSAKVVKRMDIAARRMRISPAVQRNLNHAWVDELASKFDLGQIGVFTVSHRPDGYFYVIDGQHRHAVLMRFGLDDYKVSCMVYEGLTEEEEAARFLVRNNSLTVDGFSKYRIGVQAGQRREVEIESVVRELGLHVVNTRTVGAIQAPGTLAKVYERAGLDVLRRTLQIVRDSFGDAGLQASVIDGIALVVQRYDSLNDALVVEKLRSAYGGVNGLTNEANALRLTTGAGRSQCIAAVAVKFINHRRKGQESHKRLANWWRED